MSGEGDKGRGHRSQTEEDISRVGDIVTEVTLHMLPRGTPSSYCRVSCLSYFEVFWRGILFMKYACSYPLSNRASFSSEVVRSLLESPVNLHRLGAFLRVAAREVFVYHLSYFTFAYSSSGFLLSPRSTCHSHLYLLLVATS